MALLGVKKTAAAAASANGKWLADALLRPELWTEVACSREVAPDGGTRPLSLCLRTLAGDSALVYVVPADRAGYLLRGLPAPSGSVYAVAVLPDAGAPPGSVCNVETACGLLRMARLTVLDFTLGATTPAIAGAEPVAFEWTDAPAPRPWQTALSPGPVPAIFGGRGGE